MFDPSTRPINERKVYSEKEHNELQKMYYEMVGQTLDQLLESEAEYESAIAFYHKNSGKSIEARQAGNKLFLSKNHDRKIHAEILSLYTKSIAFAEKSSEEMALGYGNRSALLFHLKKYMECLIDIDRACQITKSDALKKKLAARKEDCLLQLGKVKEDKQKLPELNFKPSRKIPCASELVTLEYNEKYGRHVVATQDIKPGTVIAVEQSFVLFPNMDHLHLICSHCLLVVWNGIPCHGCTVAVYCSEKCKTDAWQQYHDIECPILPCLYYLKEKFYNRIINLFLTIRLFIKVVKAEGWSNIIKKANFVDNDKEKQLEKFFDNKIFQSNKFQTIYSLADCEIISTEVNLTMSSKIIKLLHNKSKVFNKSEKSINLKVVDQNILSYALTVFKKLRNIVEINCEGVLTLDGQLNTIMVDQIVERGETYLGVTISPFCGLLNHSCICNIQRKFTNNRETLLFTSNLVRKGQQLFINYGTNDSMTRETRQNFLKNTFKIICDCQACNENWSSLNSVGISSTQNLDIQANFKLMSDLEKANVFIAFGSIQGFISEGPDNRTFTESTLEDVSKIITIIRKNFNDRKAYTLIYYFVKYIINYYDNFYAIQDDIPAHC